MEVDDIDRIVRDILTRIGHGRARAVFEQYSHPQDMSFECFEEVVERIGLTLVPPPDGAELGVDPVRSERVQREVWIVDVEIWTEELGRGPSWMELWIEPGDDEPVVVIMALYE